MLLTVLCWLYTQNHPQIYTTMPNESYHVSYLFSYHWVFHTTISYKYYLGLFQCFQKVGFQVLSSCICIPHWRTSYKVYTSFQNKDMGSFWKFSRSGIIIIFPCLKKELLLVSQNIYKKLSLGGNFLELHVHHNICITKLWSLGSYFIYTWFSFNTFFIQNNIIFFYNRQF